MEYSRALTTLWIALGGAAETVMRYWVGILLSRWSYTLPWGTIIINITGSFAIAFFGAATLAGGRFPALMSSDSFSWWAFAVGTQRFRPSACKRSIFCATARQAGQ